MIKNICLSYRIQNLKFEEEKRMAEAYINSKHQVVTATTSSSNKKRKNEATTSTKLKRPNISQMPAVPASNSSQPSLLKVFQHSCTTSPATSTATTSSSMDNPPSGNPISNQETIILQQAVGEVVRKTFFIGGQKCVIFWGNKGFITDIYIKEFANGKVINEGVHLNISKMLVILNCIDYMKEAIGRLTNCEKDINVKFHIGAGYHISCNSPYKNVGIRLWEKSVSGKIFPTQKGISLKFPEWSELLRVFEEIFLTHQEIYTAISCLIDKDKPNHDASKCEECISMEMPALGEVDIIIPL